MHLRITKSISTTTCAAVAILCLVTTNTGCNQQRYKPAKWRPSAGKTTLPESEVAAGDGMRWTSLPMTRMGTMPNRGGNWSTVPGRNWSTIPQRNWSTIPARGGMTTLPQRGGERRFPVPGWSTLPNRGGIGGSTMPQRETYPEYRVPRRNWSTLPRETDGREYRNAFSTLPRR